MRNLPLPKHSQPSGTLFAHRRYRLAPRLQNLGAGISSSGWPTSAGTFAENRTLMRADKVMANAASSSTSVYVGRHRSCTSRSARPFGGFAKGNGLAKNELRAGFISPEPIFLTITGHSSIKLLTILRQEV